MDRLAAVVLLGLAVSGCAYQEGASPPSQDLDDVVEITSREAVMRARLRDNDLRLTRLSRIELQIEDRLNALGSPLDAVGERLWALRSTSDRLDVPEDVVEAAVASALEHGEVRLPERLDPDVRARWSALLVELVEANDTLDAVLAEVGTTHAELAVLAHQARRLRREVEDVAAAAAADRTLPEDLRRAAMDDQRRADRLHRSVDARLELGIELLESIPSRAASLRWHLRHPFDATRLSSLPEAS